MNNATMEHITIMVEHETFLYPKLASIVFTLGGELLDINRERFI